MPSLKVIVDLIPMCSFIQFYYASDYYAEILCYKLMSDITGMLSLLIAKQNTKIPHVPATEGSTHELTPNK